MTGLKLTLYAPLQHYSTKNAVSYGTMETLYMTETHPTKSAVCGLLGCALGYKREDRRIKDLHDLKMYWKTEKGNREILSDYQTAKPLRPEEGFKNSKGKTIENGLIKTVQYVADTEFSVYIEGDDATLKKLHCALEHPVWAPYLGKKSCHPAKPITTRSYKTEEIPNDAVECI